MNKKSKTEKLLSPSSSWRENHHHLPHRRNQNSPTTVSSSGCLPGFFNLLLSTFHFSSNRRKSLTLGSKKRDLKTLVSASPENDVVAPPLLPTEDPARVSLVGALEKCDRDLEELRRTIDVIKTTFILHKKLEVSPPTPPPQLFTVDRFLSDKTVARDVHVGTQTQIKKITQEESDHEYNNRIYRINNNNYTNLINRFDYNIHDVVFAKRAIGRRVRRSLRESVNQVCDEVDSGQRREVARIALTLHDQICRDLVAETVREFFDSYADVEEEEEKEYSKFRRGNVASLPLDACRKRLVF